MLYILYDHVKIIAFLNKISSYIFTTMTSFFHFFKHEEVITQVSGIIRFIFSITGHIRSCF